MSDVAAPAGLLDRAIRRITHVWRDMAAGVGRDEDESIGAQMRACLNAHGGEVSARNRAAKLAQAYLVLDDAGRRDFLRVLAGFDSPPDAVAAAYADLQKANDAASNAAAKTRLRRVLEPPRMRLLTQFTTIPDGMKFLVDLRASLLAQMKDDKLLAALENDLRGLLASWFDVGFLELQRIDWNSPAALLEKLVGYEAVHQIRSWTDLKNRLDSDRRCYAFFHPRMPSEPLIFVEVAMVQGLAGSVQHLLDPKAPLQDPAEADAAIFYSISNCQAGLAGISFGNFLIKRVVELLGTQFRNLRIYATLSPLPGFGAWLDKTLRAPEDNVMSAEEAAALVAALAGEKPATGKAKSGDAARPDAKAGAQALLGILVRRHWVRNAGLTDAAEPVLLRLAARYLLGESRGRRALDPVAHFHLSNGARVERLNMLADVSDKGVKESATVMVNYLYDPARIEAYHEDYRGEGKRNASVAVRRLVRGWL